MYESELRTYALGAVVCVALGAGIGFGWNLPGHRGERAAVAIRRRTSARGTPPVALTLTMSLKCWSAHVRKGF